MAIVTSQQISQYYEEYRNTEITFTKDIIRTLAMDPRQIYVKCNGGQWPCIVNSTSFTQVRIIVGTKGSAYTELSKKGNPPASVRFCFFEPNGQFMNFFIAGRVAELAPFAGNGDLALVTIEFSQRPPDDFIEMIGHLLDANMNAVRRKEERIAINQDSLRKLGIPKSETIVIVQNVPRHCVLRNLSFGGASIVLMGLRNFLVNKDVILKVDFDEPHETIQLGGKIISAAPLEGRKDVVSANIAFAEQMVPLSYKIHINSYLNTTRKIQMDKVSQQGMSPEQLAQAAASLKAMNGGGIQSADGKTEAASSL